MDFKKKPKISVLAKILAAALWIVAIGVFIAAVLCFFVDVQIPEESESYSYSAIIKEKTWH